MSHEVSSILDVIRPGDVLIVVRLDHVGRNPGTVSIARTHGPDCAGMVVEMVAWLYPRSAARGYRSRKAEGRLQGPPGHFDRVRFVWLRKEGMGDSEIAKAVGCKPGNGLKTLKAAGLTPSKKSGPKAALKGSRVQFLCWPPF
jgi:hypothetical protein